MESEKNCSIPPPPSGQVSPRNPDKEDYSTSLSNGCNIVLDTLQMIWPDDSLFWDPPVISSELFQQLPEPVKELLIDATNEAIYDQFEKQRFYDDPVTKEYKKKTLRPRKIGKQTLLKAVGETLEQWRIYPIRNGRNVDKLLTKTVLQEGTPLFDIRKDEVTVKNRIVEDIFSEMLDDAIKTVINSLNPVPRRKRSHMKI